MTDDKRFEGRFHGEMLVSVRDTQKDCNVNILQIIEIANVLADENKQLKEDVEYWKQVASQYNNELNVFKHCEEHKTKCKDIYWGSDV